MKKALATQDNKIIVANNKAFYYEYVEPVETSMRMIDNYEKMSSIPWRNYSEKDYDEAEINKVEDLLDKLGDDE